MIFFKHTLAMLSVVVYWSQVHNYPCPLMAYGKQRPTLWTMVSKKDGTTKSSPKRFVWLGSTDIGGFRKNII